ncbi:hypothetical protein K0M31_001352 [Melipona bicolor]|uniref:Uncharacterized protein n=1 Tax=Melipona bicolor TaxID=60889 RepID=A0AA40GFB9_9HYME|nr:hypothetical protein K0M31_001352 [Melipona bicolor]
MGQLRKKRREEKRREEKRREGKGREGKRRERQRRLKKGKGRWMTCTSLEEDNLSDRDRDSLANRRRREEETLVPRGETKTGEGSSVRHRVQVIPVIGCSIGILVVSVHALERPTIYVWVDEVCFDVCPHASERTVCLGESQKGSKKKKASGGGGLAVRRCRRPVRFPYAYAKFLPPTLSCPHQPAKP